MLFTVSQRMSKPVTHLGMVGREDVLTRLTGLLTLLFIRATRPFTRSLGEKGRRAQAPSAQHAGAEHQAQATSQKKTNPNGKLDVKIKSCK